MLRLGKELFLGCTAASRVGGRTSSKEPRGEEVVDSVGGRCERLEVATFPKTNVAPLLELPLFRLPWRNC